VTSRNVVGERTSLRELAGLFLRLGCTSFGGPAVHVAMMRDEVVVRRRWATNREFLDLVGATNLIPGPNSTELAIHVGRERRGTPGSIVAGLAFLAPAVCATGALAWVYVTYGSLPQASGILYGIKPVVLAVVVIALWNLGRSAARTPSLIALGVACSVAAWIGVHELLVLLVAGIVAMLASRLRPRRPTRGADARDAATAKDDTSTVSLLPLAPLYTASTPTAWTSTTSELAAVGAAGSTLAATASITLPAIFWVFCKIGAVLFGSGYVLLAFLRSELVERLHWLTEAQLVDAIAVGQVTPGPVFSTATFVGYLLQGPWGALAATCGIFLPAFVFVAVSAPFLPRLRASPTAGALLDGVNVASLALMAVVTARLTASAVVDVPTIVIAVAGIVSAVKYRVNTTWLVLGGAIAGIALQATGATS